jgi:hypothetical protein
MWTPSGFEPGVDDVDTTGTSPEHDPERDPDPDPTPPEGWTQNPYVQVESGFVAGVSLGLVPFGASGSRCSMQRRCCLTGRRKRGEVLRWGRSSAG